jgi:hypothetical protein
VTRRFSLVVTILAAAACSGTGPDPLSYHSVEITRGGLPDEGLGPMAWHRVMPGGNPDSMLVTLLRAGVPVRQAYAPLDNECLDPVGPTFAVVLGRNDARMTGFGYEAGGGRLLCASILRRYEVE